MNTEPGFKQYSEPAGNWTFLGSALFCAGRRLVHGAALALLLCNASISFADENDSDAPPGPAPGFQSAIQAQMSERPVRIAQPAPETDADDHSHPLLVASALTIGALVVLRRLLPRIADAVNRRSVLWEADAVAAGEAVTLQQQALETFARAFEQGPATHGEPGAPESLPTATQPPQEVNRAPTEQSVRDFLVEKDGMFRANWRTPAAYTTNVMAGF